MKILILCTGNSCRSQMAEGFLKSIDSTLTVKSAGTNPERLINKNAVKVMSEIGIDISRNKTKNADSLVNDEWDYVITVCDNAKESCPVFIGRVKNRLHIGFEDPADAIGTEEQVLPIYRKVRDEIVIRFEEFYKTIIKG